MPESFVEMRPRWLSDGVVSFFVLACGITWACTWPLALLWTQHIEPPGVILGMAAVGAFGPTLAAFYVAAQEGELREVFGRWRTSPLWIGAALLAPMALHSIANLLEVALGGSPQQWFYPPVRPEHSMALILFSVGEEFGWRGYAYRKLASRSGRVQAALAVGLVWAIWHLTMTISPATGRFDPALALSLLLELPLYSVVVAWFFERSNRSMAVAIAIHAGAHLDNVNHAPSDELRLRVLRLVVVLVAAVFAVRSLSRQDRLALE